MTSQFILGWEEWVSLPELGLPAIKAKIDTGARTSALHAALIEPFGTADKPMVRFVVHPRPGRDDLAIVCAAAVADRREVTSSNGESELRYVIVTPVSVGGVTWPIEMTLTNREGMSYRMLLGRKAIRSDMFVDATASFRQPRLSFKVYGRPQAVRPPARPLRFCVLTLRPDAPTVRRLAAAAAKRGHAVELLDLSGKIEFSLSGAVPGLTVGGVAVAHYDVIIARLGPGNQEMAAAVRQMEMMGGAALNSGNALDRLRNPFAVAQALARARIPVTRSLTLGVSGEPPSIGGELHFTGAPQPVGGDTRRLQFLVVGRREVAAMDVSQPQPRRVLLRHLGAERKLARRAAAALRLGLAAVEVAVEESGARVAAVSAMPRLRRFQRVCGVDATERVIEAGEKKVKGRVAMAVHGAVHGAVPGAAER